MQDFPHQITDNIGDIFQETIGTWLSRPSPDRAQQVCFDLPVVLATDIGLQRTENQDRVAAFRINHSQPIIAIVVADGMGGMRDGEKCASLAISSFFYALALNRHQGIEQRAAAAISFANDIVHKFAGGHGGATFSALLFDIGAAPVIINVGDSRIYSCGKGVKLERLTIDDSLEEAVGGHGRELLQFMGMGKGIQPHIKSISADVQQLAITSDGIHYIDQSTFASVLFHASEPKTACERLSALARWCGGHDNASIALVDLKAVSSHLSKSQDGTIQIWDPFGMLSITWLRNGHDAPQRPLNTTDEKLPAKAAANAPPPTPKERKTARRTPKKPERNRGQAPSKDEIQLEIQIEKSPDPKDDDDHRE